jgi:hypothetical protein
MKIVEILLLKQTVFLHHKGFGDNKAVHLISLDVASISLPRRRGQNRIQDAKPVPFGNEELDKVITVVGR